MIRTQSSIYLGARGAAERGRRGRFWRFRLAGIQGDCQEAPPGARARDLIAGGGANARDRLVVCRFGDAPAVPLLLRRPR